MMTGGPADVLDPATADQAAAGRTVIVLAPQAAHKPEQLLEQAGKVFDSLFPEFAPCSLSKLKKTQSFHQAFSNARGPGLAAIYGWTKQGVAQLGLSLPAGLIDGTSLTLLTRAICDPAAGLALQRLADHQLWRQGFDDDASAPAVTARKWWSKRVFANPAWPFIGAAANGAGRLHRCDGNADATTCAALVELTQEHGWNSATPWLAAWWLLLRVIADRPITIWTAANGRSYQELEHCLGCLDRLVPHAWPLEPGTALLDLCSALDRDVANGLSIQDFGPSTDHPQISFAHRLDPGNGIWREVTRSSADAASDLSLQIVQTASGASVQLIGKSDFIGHAELIELADMLNRVLAGFGAGLNQAWEDVLPGGDVAAPVPAKALPTIVSAIERWVVETPMATAVVDGFDSLNYGQLWRRSEVVAKRLLQLGAGPGRPVALLAEKSVSSAAAVLGIWRAGAAYLPLDPGHPDERLRGLIAQAGAVVTVCEPAAGPRAASLGLPTLLVTDDDGDGSALLPAVTHDLAAYCIATSGSTGKPKLVVVEHGNLAAYGDGAIALIGLENSPKSYAMVTGWATDLGLTMVAAAWITGGSLHLLPIANLVQANAFSGFVQAHGIEILKITPSHLKALLSQPGSAGVLPAQKLILGGETVPWGLIETVQGLAPLLEIWNHYGPTETTIGAIAGRLDLGAPRHAEVPALGQPFANLAVSVRGRDGRTLANWLPGEIFIAGPTVARGYAGSPVASAERFLPAADGHRAYATGDRARRMPDGRIVFLGRTDFQVKIGGHRVDPGEAEAALRSQPGVAGAVVVSRPDDAGELRLIAYVVPGAGSGFDPPVWRKALAAQLPPAAIPTVYVEVAAIPLRDNGKPALDQLPDPLPEPQLGSGEGKSRTTRDRVAAIWTELLGVAEVDPHERFFDLGGHSLQMLAMHQMLVDRMGVDISLLELFASPTVAGIADLVDGPSQNDVANSAAARATRQRAAIAGLHRRRKEDLSHDS